MRRFACACTLILLFGQGHGAHAGAPEPVCRVQSVLDVMSHELERRSHYVRIDPELVFEQTTTAPNVIRCAVCALTARYDMLRFDDHPVLRCEAHAFDVRTVPNGFVVRYRQ